ncbi:hypothetical protein MAM1_0207c08013 [Mucor ambiguus]|uniref:Uncharacterized protein n=1 Tax=Mucor ambiguus TaxID=91626 RepID=A0A0C9MLS2_9FUNG|nr:hypothetical protein MAM1_0207c08013 [Mucor ambiguus]
MAGPTQYSPDDTANDDTGLGSPLIPLDLGVDYSLSYPSFSESSNAFIADTNNARNEEPEDMQEVLDALLDLHSLKNTDPMRFEKDYVTILKAINLNEELQGKVQDQIQLVEEQLDTNSKLLKEASLYTLEENRCGSGFPIHTLYRDPINYFDSDELLKPVVQHKSNAIAEGAMGEDLLLQLDDDADYLNDDDEEVDEAEEHAMNSADNEHNRSHKAWSRTERERLEEGIISEAKRIISFDFVKRKEEWRIWEVDKMEKKDLLMFPVSRFEWDRISSLHVFSRSPIECLIQWTTQEHPTINKKPWSKQESQKLAELVQKIGLFSGQWERIASELGTNRTISQCFSHYMYEKNNTHARSLKWTKEEDKKLTDAVKLFGNCNWQQVADILGDRTGQQCLHRWQKSLNPVIKRQRWNTEEDALLQRAVHLYGAGNWTKIQRLIPGRTDMQCRERWVNILQPSINRGQFTQEETDRLLELVETHGPKWSFLQTLMPGRTDNALMRHYKNIVKGAEPSKKKTKTATTKPKKPKKPASKQAPKKRPRPTPVNETPTVHSKRTKTNEGDMPLRRSTRARRPTYQIEDDSDKKAPSKENLTWKINYLAAQVGEKTHMKTAILAASRAKYQQIHNRNAGEMDRETLMQELYNARKLKLETKLYQARKDLKTALKKAKNEETQKQNKKIKSARKLLEKAADEKEEGDEEAEKKPKKKVAAEDIELYEKELEVVKSVDLDALVEKTLKSKLQKNAELKNEDLIKDLIESFVKAKKTEDKILQNIESRLIANKAVISEINIILSSFQSIIKGNNEKIEKMKTIEEKKKQAAEKKKRQAEEEEQKPQAAKKPRVTKAKKAGTSEFFETLGDVADDENEDENFKKIYEGEKKPNRAGQRQRRNEYQKREEKRLANPDYRPKKKPTPKPKPAAVHHQKPSAPAEPVHPSWEAKRIQEEIMSKALSGKGKSNKKIVFDDSD